MSPRVLALAVALVVASLPGGARASGYVARLTGKACLECHLDAHGRRGLNPTGERFHRSGYRYAFDPELTVAGEGAPLTPGGAQMLTRRYRDQGRVVFGSPATGRNRTACVSCHAGGKGLEGAAGRYPAPDPATGHWLTLEGAINRCLVGRMKGRPLLPGSPTAVGLALWIRDGFTKPSPVIGD